MSLLSAIVHEQPARIDKTAVLDHLTSELVEAQEMQAAARSYARLLSLLVEARAALGPEYFDLAGRIDDQLRPALAVTMSSDGLVLERLPNGQLAWLRP